jgi:hypothetical protein
MRVRVLFLTIAGMMTWSSENLNMKSKSPIPGAPNVEVVLLHFHRHRYKSGLLWFFVGEGLARTRCKLLSKWFYDISIGTATRAVRCGSLLERAWLA